MGQPRLRQALLLLAVDPRLQGLLVRGDRGTGKSTAVRALAPLLPPRPVRPCEFGCLPERPHTWCHTCRDRAGRQEAGSLAADREAAGPPETVLRWPALVTLPLGATEDQLLGTFDLALAMKTGERRFVPGLLARAHAGLLYVDEVNLLEDSLVDLLLDAAASGINVVAREGMQLVHPAELALVGTMNPEEGELRPQLTDRFGLSVTLSPITDPAVRARVVATSLGFEDDPGAFAAAHAPAEEALRRRIREARSQLPRVQIPPELLERAAELSVVLETPGHRGDLLAIKAARALAALAGRDRAGPGDLSAAAELVYPHRLPRRPFEENADPLARIHDGLARVGLPVPSSPTGPDTGSPHGPGGSDPGKKKARTV